MEERTADSKRNVGALAVLPPESNILGFTHKHVTFESREAPRGPVPPSQMPQTCSQPQALVSLHTGFSR